MKPSVTLSSTKPLPTAFGPNLQRKVAAPPTKAKARLPRATRCCVAESNQNDNNAQAPLLSEPKAENPSVGPNGVHLPSPFPFFSPFRLPVEEKDSMINILHSQLDKDISEAKDFQATISRLNEENDRLRTEIGDLKDRTRAQATMIVDLEAVLRTIMK